jgi:hypothetical protein
MECRWFYSDAELALKSLAAVDPNPVEDFDYFFMKNVQIAYRRSLVLLWCILVTEIIYVMAPEVFISKTGESLG